jgi:hypothetical protein
MVVVWVEATESAWDEFIEEPESDCGHKRWRGVVIVAANKGTNVRGR